MNHGIYGTGDEDDRKSSYGGRRWRGNWGDRWYLDGKEEGAAAIMAVSQVASQAGDDVRMKRRRALGSDWCDDWRRLGKLCDGEEAVAMEQGKLRWCYSQIEREL